MRRIRICRACLRSALSRIHLVDRCLILFMLVLLGQSAYSLFFHGGTQAGAGDIDIIVRTSSAAIFGYFLSANFIRHTPPDAAPRQDAGTAGRPVAEAGNNNTVRPNGLRSQIGFFSPSDAPQRLPPPDADSAAPQSSAQKNSSCNRLQIIVAASIGLFCLVTLLLIRNVDPRGGSPAGSAASAATVAQFRDFVSGCVGFLIGSPTHYSGQAES